ncbi:MAG: hypothetical protein HRU34_08605 [Richelia sp.]|nr:hypothetical protein [Richelia sp.]
MSRRGEVAWVRDLPLVSAEGQCHPVLSIAPLKPPQLGSSALPFNAPVPNVDSGSATKIGRYCKTPIANYITPPAPAFAPPPEVLNILQSAQVLLKSAKAAFPKGSKFTYPRQNAVLQERHTFATDGNEAKLYGKFIAQPNTGIFRVLPDKMLQQFNGFTNRLQAVIRERYTFPPLGKNQDNFTPKLSLQVVDNQFAMKNRGADYSLMVNLGDIPLEDIDTYLKQDNHSQKNFLLNYQPPQQFKKLQIDRRRFLTGKLQDNIPAKPIFAQLPAQLNQT